jgi:hypothetical protein
MYSVCSELFVSIIINYGLDHADVGSTDYLVVEDFSFFFLFSFSS